METSSTLLALCVGNSPVTGHWRGALIFSLIGAWINALVNNREADDFRRHCAHYDIVVMIQANIHPLIEIQLCGIGRLTRGFQLFTISVVAPTVKVTRLRQRQCVAPATWNLQGQQESTKGENGASHISQHTGMKVISYSMFVVRECNQILLRAR